MKNKFKKVLLLSLPVLAISSINAMATAVPYNNGAMQGLTCTASPSGYGFCHHFQPPQPGSNIGVYHTNLKQFVFNMGSLKGYLPALQFQGNKGAMNVCLSVSYLTGQVSQTSSVNCSEKNTSNPSVYYEGITTSATYSSNGIVFKPIAWTMQLPGISVMKIPAVSLTMSAASETATPAQTSTNDSSGGLFFNAGFLRK